MAGEQIKRSISLAVTDGQVVLQEFQRVGRGGEAELDRIGGAAANNNKRLEETAGAAEGMSRRSRAAFANLGNQVQDVFVQVQGGTDVFRALSQQVPQALDAFAMWAPALTFVGAGVAILLPFVGSLIERLFAMGGAQKEAAADAEAHKKALDDQLSSMHVSSESLTKFQAGLTLVTEAQRDLVRVNLEQTLEADNVALKRAGEALDAYVARRTKPAGGVEAVAPTTSRTPQLSDLEQDTDRIGLSPPGAEEQDTFVQQTQVHAEAVRQLYDQYKAGVGDLQSFTDGLRQQKQALGDTDESARKDIDSLLELVDAQNKAQKATELHKAQLDLLNALLGDPKAFTAADQKALNYAAAMDQATASLVKFDIADRQATTAQAADMLVATGHPEAADALRIESQNQINQLRKQLQTDADRNAIVLRVGVDAGEAERLRSALEAAGRKTGETLKDEIAHIKEAGAATNASQAAVNQLIQEAVDKRQQVADKAKKEREEQELIHAGLAKTKEQADALLSSTNDRYAGLQGVAKIEAEIADKRRAEQVLTGPGEAAHRAELETQINNLVGQRNDLLQKQSEKLAQIDKSNKDVLDSLDAGLAKSASKDITQDVIDTAGQAARNRIKLPTPEERAQPGGMELFDRAKMEQDLAYAKGAATELDKFFADADQQIAKDDEKVAAARERAIGLTDKLISPQERYNDEVAKLAPLLDGNVDDQIRYNKAIDELDRRLPILQKEYELRKKRQAIEELEQSGNPLDWANAGFKSIQLEAEDTGKEVSGAFKSGFDEVNHGFFEMVAGQKQGWTDLKGAALSFVDTLGEVALKQFEIMAINQTIGLIGSFAGGLLAPSYSAPAAGNYGAVMQSGDIMASYGHTGIVAGQGGRTSFFSAETFDEAPRFHGGGTIGPDERPIIAKVGERVLTPEQNKDWEGGGSRAVTIRQEVHNIYSGIYDMRQLQAVTDMSAQKSHAQLARAVRSDPNVRRQLGRS